MVVTLNLKSIDNGIAPESVISKLTIINVDVGVFAAAVAANRVNFSVRFHKIQPSKLHSLTNTQNDFFPHFALSLIEFAFIPL